jgi:hypothetical protein
VYHDEVPDESLGQDFTSDFNERVKMPMAREAPPQPQRFERARRATDKLNLMITGKHDIMLLGNDVLMTYAEAMTNPNSKNWQNAMQSEIDFMGDNQVWNLVDLPDGIKPIECKWTDKKKRDTNGNVHIHKARLVVKGY